ncbi:hypothetical protein MKW92_005134 [Papaver armeniacum]|nr:hypothetical protein MKW92_005134 [Papaver armeniacum]
MGGHYESWAQPNGLLPNEAAFVTRPLEHERWMKAEERTAELIACIQPNQPSEELRNAVADYVQRLIMRCFTCQVFTFGSVPLKTYLPDGDIDLTAFSDNPNAKDTWANEVRIMLENEEKSDTAEFRVKEVQYIQAEVKIIKCLVENIVVDISFNQLGGLCTLCFLEEVDHLINQNHLFKRSIILIKAWCYYESRILGAHHGLISTYALETLVLYIFHVFNNDFAGPLEVLYRFLEFFSNFDWENFCLSLWGPIPITALPDMTAESPRKDTGELLLKKQFLNVCTSVYAVVQNGQENQGQPFVAKHFNVVDPLRTNNNLGRSVSKGNFFRIRSAFAFGAKRLARLLDCPNEDLIGEVNLFFLNTWDRHGNGRRPDAPTGGSESIHTEKVQRTRPFIASELQEKFRFARTRSSPELSDASRVVSSRGSRYEAPETGNSKIVTAKADSNSYRRKNSGSDVSVGHIIRSSTEDPSSLRDSSSHHSLDDSADSNTASNSLYEGVGLSSYSPELSSADDSVDKHQEEQDLVNMMASSGLHGFPGQIQMPMHLGSPHLPFPVSPSILASMGYGQRNFAGMVPREHEEVYFERNENLRSSHASSSRSTDFVENTWDESSMTGYKSTRDKRGRKVSPSSVPSTVYGKGRPGRQYEGSPASQGSSVADDDSRDWIQLSTAGSELVERSNMEPTSHKLSISGSDSMIPVGPMFLGPGSHHRAMNNGGALPFAFYPTGPPVPFLTMLPVYNFPNEAGNSEGSSSHFDRLEGQDSEHTNQSDQNFDSADINDQSDNFSNSNSIKGAASLESLEENKAADILHSDFASHWQNLQFGRLCQFPRSQGGPLIYPSPVAVPPVYLQGNFPWDGPGRPVSGNVNLVTQLPGYGPRLVPVAPLQPSSSRPAGVYQRFGDEAPRYRGGTGTYLPNPKISFREQQNTSPKNQRVNHSYDRNDYHGDREGSWNINSRPRASGRSHGRNQAGKPNSRPDRLGGSDSRSNRPWDSYMNGSFTSYQSQAVAFGSPSLNNGSNSVTYGMYPLPAVNSNGGSPTGSVVMVYPYGGHNVDYGSPAEQLEFGSLRQEHFSGINEDSQRGEGVGSTRGLIEQQRFRGGSKAHSSPDQPSSPQLQR